MEKKSTHWLLLLLALPWGLIPPQAAAQAPAPELTLSQAVAVGLAQNPAAALAQADQQAATAAVAQARAAWWPRLQFSENFTRGNDPVYVFGTRLRQHGFTAADFALEALNRPAPINNFATQFGATWELFNWGATRNRVQSASLVQQSAAAMGRQADQSIVLRVVEAYQGVLIAQQLQTAAEHEVTTATALLQQAQSRVKAGLAVDSDQLSAQVNLSERQQQAITAAGNVETAWAGLAAAMGVDQLPRHGLAPLAPRQYPQGSLDDAVSLALRSRPDLEALRHQQAASEASVRAARGGFLPTVSAFGDWESDRGSFAGQGGQHWVAGVQVQLDVLPLGQRAELRRQLAARAKAAAQQRASEQQARLAVQQAWTAQHTAGQVVATAQASLRQAAEGLRILQNRYNAGLTTMTGVLSAEDAQHRSETGYWQAVYDNTVAYAELLYATGTLTPAAAGGLQ